MAEGAAIKGHTIIRSIRMCSRDRAPAAKTSARCCVADGQANQPSVANIPHQAMNRVAEPIWTGCDSMP